MSVLVLNAGSSSLKAAVFAPDLATLGAVTVAEIGGDSRLHAATQQARCHAPNHAAALALCLDHFANQGLALNLLSAAAHRVVHGGQSLVAACHITADVRARIAALVPLAPLHNPPALAVLDAIAARTPELPQVACFDTAFHITIPDVATTYAVPQSDRATGLRRYGFHGLSYESLVARLPTMTGTPLPRRLLALHLGNGASACAILAGRSVATTMGFSPIDGLTMGTRGGVDGSAVLALATRHGVARAAAILNREGGMLALGGASDMRKLHAAGTPEAAFAVDHFCYWAVRHAGSLIAALGGLDALAFTGGIGENDALVRGRILGGLDWAGVAFDAAKNNAHNTALHDLRSVVQVYVVPADEERHIAGEAMALMGRAGV